MLVLYNAYLLFGPINITSALLFIIQYVLRVYSEPREDSIVNQPDVSSSAPWSELKQETSRHSGLQQH